MGDMIDKDVVLAIMNDHVQVGSMIEAITALPAAPMGVKPLEIENAVWSAMLWAADNNVGFNAALEYDPLGNSYAQIECRSAARRILAALTPQPAPTLADALELPEIKALVEAAFYEGFAEGMDGGWDEGDHADAWKKSAALTALQTKGGA